ncbi:MAG: hypothetical protein JW789_03065 [Candidatus Aenigmarchaeota archaeon]|nr:hypothetical protein [Candidatus Aenigmarchaeota archaeon]
MHLNEKSPATSHIIDAAFYTAFPEYKNGTPGPSYTDGINSIDVLSLRKIFSVTPKNVANFLAKDDHMQNFFRIYQLAEKFGYDQWDINQSDYRTLVTEIVMEYIGTDDFAPVIRDYIGHRLGKLNGELDESTEMKIGMYAAELFEMNELKEEITRLQSPQA